MDASVSVVGTGLVVIGGQWARNRRPTIQQFAGFGIYATLIAIISKGAASGKLAEQLALLVFITALFLNAVPIVQATGLGKKK